MVKAAAIIAVCSRGKGKETSHVLGRGQLAGRIGLLPDWADYTLADL